MSRFIEIQHDEWIAAGPDVVRAHYTDLNHRQIARVHPHEREHHADGSVVDTCVSGSHWGRSISARFWRRNDDERPGTLVEMTVTQPLRPLLGRVAARWIRRRVERELREFATEEKVDVERGYQVQRRLRVA